MSATFEIDTGRDSPYTLCVQDCRNKYRSDRSFDYQGCIKNCKLLKDPKYDEGLGYVVFAPISRSGISKKKHKFTGKGRTVGTSQRVRKIQAKKLATARRMNRTYGGFPKYKSKKQQRRKTLGMGVHRLSSFIPKSKRNQTLVLTGNVPKTKLAFYARKQREICGQLSSNFKLPELKQIYKARFPNRPIGNKRKPQLCSALALSFAKDL